MKLCNISVAGETHLALVTSRGIVDLQAAGGPRCAHRHVFTHRVWNMQLVLALPPREPLEGVFVDAEGLRALPMASAFAPFRERALHLMKES